MIAYKLRGSSNLELIIDIVSKGRVYCARRSEFSDPLRLCVMTFHAKTQRHQGNSSPVPIGSSMSNWVMDLLWASFKVERLLKLRRFQHSVIFIASGSGRPCSTCNLHTKVARTSLQACSSEQDPEHGAAVLGC